MIHASSHIVGGFDQLTLAISQITGLQAWMAGVAIKPFAISDTTGLQTALDGKAASSHTHIIADITGLQTALDGKSSTSHTHTHASTTGRTTDDHHNKSHAHDGADGSGTVTHSNITAKTANDHHDKSHVHNGVDGSGTVSHANLTGVTEDQHHLKLHAANHASGMIDAITLAESQVTNLVTDLAGKAATTHTHTEYAGIAETETISGAWTFSTAPLIGAGVKLEFRDANHYIISNALNWLDIVVPNTGYINFQTGSTVLLSFTGYYVYMHSSGIIDWGSGQAQVYRASTNELSLKGYTNIKLYTNSGLTATFNATSGLVLADFTTNYITSVDAYTNTTTASALHINSSGIIRRTASALRFKEDITDLDEKLALDAIKALKPRRFHWKNTDVQDITQWAYGLIAEEVYRILPESVTHPAIYATNVDGKRLHDESGRVIPIGIDYSMCDDYQDRHIVGILIKTVQNLLLRIEKLEGNI